MNKMAAAQQKKRLSSSNLHEQNTGKKKKSVLPDYVLNLKPRIHLEWDGSQKVASAKREQIGIAWNDMAPFVASVPQSHSGLADVLIVPQGIFCLENLTEVLSYETWATCLSESDRKLLTQFLPGGTGAEQTVRSLLMGENHHFGNPFLKWSSSLCSGNLHPDNVLRVERQIRANKKAYYSELNEYNTDMIEVLKKYKERCAHCKDPDELRKAVTKLKQESGLVSTERAKLVHNTKKEIPQKMFIKNGDTAKYISYIKITRKQHELVKTLARCGEGIQSKSLSHVLGDIKDFHVHSYEAFEEEEKDKLHDHWLQVVKKDLPVCLENHKDYKLQKEQWKMSLVQELAEKMSITDKTEDMDKLESSPQGQTGDGESAYSEQDSAAITTHDRRHLERIPSLNSHQELNPMALDEGVGSVIWSTHDSHHLEDIPSLNAHQDSSCMVLDEAAASRDTPQQLDISPILPHFFGETNTKRGAIETTSISTTKGMGLGMWQDVSNRSLNYHGTPESHHKLTLGHPRTTELSPAGMIDPEREILEREAGDPLASSLHMDHGDPLFYPYMGQSRDKLLSPFSKGPRMQLTEYQNNLTQPGLQIESGQISHRFQEQQLIDQRQAREKELFVHQALNKNMYPVQGHSPSMESRSLFPIQSSMTGGMFGHGWLTEDLQNGWSGVGSSRADQCLGGGGSTDGSLFSVLSECRQLPSQLPYKAANSEQFVPERSFVGDIMPNDPNVHGYTPHQLKGPSVHDAAAASSGLDMWMSYPHQHDPIGKPFLRSWNQ